MNKPDFEKAAKEYRLSFGIDGLPPTWVIQEMFFVAGCEHAYSIDKETIERLEKENKEKDKRIHDFTYALKTIKFDLDEGKLYQDTKFFSHLINQALKS